MTGMNPAAKCLLVACSAALLSCDADEDTGDSTNSKPRAQGQNPSLLHPDAELPPWLEAE
jgi:hypothetical protein